MHRLTRSTAAAALVPLLLGLAACGGESEGDREAEEARQGAAACGTLPSADPAATLPSDFPALPDQVLYEPSKQGSTSIVFGRVAGSDFVALRDQLVEQLKSSGYTDVETDQESVEAEAEFRGKHEGTIKVQKLCDGQLSIRYKLES